MGVTVGFGEAGWFGGLEGDCAGLLVGLFGGDCVGEGEGVSMGEEDVRTGDSMGFEVVEGAAAVLEGGFVLSPQAVVQTIAPLQFSSESEGQQPPVNFQSIGLVSDS
jgi:hypothetical protein